MGIFLHEEDILDGIPKTLIDYSKEKKLIKFSHDSC